MAFGNTNPHANTRTTYFPGHGVSRPLGGVPEVASHDPQRGDGHRVPGAGASRSLAPSGLVAGVLDRSMLSRPFVPGMAASPSRGCRHAFWPASDTKSTRHVDQLGEPGGRPANPRALSSHPAPGPKVTESARACRIGDLGLERCCSQVD
jgi:hypothetical protein